MSDSVFTQGVERRGINTEYEIKIIICWLIFKIKQQVSASQIITALLTAQLVNYFEVTDAIAHLISAGNIMEIDDMLYLSEKGEKTAVQLYRSIPIAARELAIDHLAKCVLKDRFASENKAEIVEKKNGFTLKLSFCDVGEDLMSISVFLPTKELCETMKKRFLEDPTQVYQDIVSALSQNDERQAFL